mmetsp:Transcript_49580/g.114916  ORF Transcript_49580/g.114916 Transcript_49580/m.114916 type:complete len:324 (+) Transcript_49580:65-1036(+)
MALTSNQKVGIGFVFWFTIGLLGCTVHGGYTVTDSLYLMAQVITTVGYGDLIPTTNAGFLFQAFFVMSSVLMLSGCASALLSDFVQNQQNKVQRKVDYLLTVAFGDKDGDGEPDLPTENRGCCQRFCKWYLAQKDLRRCIRALLIWFCCVFVGMLFFSHFPGEDKTLIEAFYMCVITLSTVGYGDKTPNTETGKAFATIWMLVGTAALADLVSKFSVAFVDDSTRKQFGPAALSAPMLDCIFEDEDINKSVVDRTPKGTPVARTLHRSDFIVFVLKDMGIVDRETIAKINQTFDRLDKNQSGCLDDDDVRAFTRRTSYEPPQV